MLGCVYGGLGIVQAVQNTLNKLWGVPRDSRPNPVKAWLRSLLLLAFGGVSVIVTTVLAALGAADAYGASLGVSVRGLATAAAIALNATSPPRTGVPTSPMRRPNGTKLREHRRELRRAPAPRVRGTASLNGIRIPPAAS